MLVLRKKVEYLLKHNLFIRSIYKLIMSSLFKFIGIFIKTDKNLVLVNSFAGRKYNDSPKVITDYLYNNQFYNHLKIVWAFDNPDNFEIPFSKVKIDTWKYFHVALKAKYWITCVNIERGLNFKKKNTVYLNSWHGIPIKSVGNTTKGWKDFNMSNVNIFCYSSNYEEKIYIRDFGIKKENMLKSGMPRNDELYFVSEEKILKIKHYLNIPINKKIILYIPTWRDSEDYGKSYTLQPPIDISLWSKKLEDYILLFRVHPFTTQLMGIEFNDFVINVSDYPNINELMIIADILISDYSAAIFDYSILERPIISFAYDFDEYKASRGIFVDLEKELPGNVLRTQYEVLDKIKTMDFVTESQKTLLVKNKYVEVGGNATEMCVKALFDNYTTIPQ